MTTTLPTLYKRNSNATAVQQWTISVDGATITTTYGQVGGAMQTTSDTIAEGKNLGKKNAKHAFEHQDEWIGRHLRYKYQGLTADGLPAFRRGLCRVD